MRACGVRQWRRLLKQVSVSEYEPILLAETVGTSTRGEGRPADGDGRRKSDPE